MLADELDDERLRDDLGARRQGVEVEDDDAVECVLADVGDAASFELLAQNHAEERGFGRIFRRSLREEDGARLWACRDVQQVVPTWLAYAQEDGGFRRLRDLVDASARESVAQLLDERLCGKAIKAHDRHLFFRKRCLLKYIIGEWRGQCS